ncbi:hypothetical protein ABE530_03160 [Brucella sp. TWI559]
MNVTMKLTFDGLVRALRFKQIALREEIATWGSGSRGDKEKLIGEHNEEQRGSIAESTL